MPQSIKTRRLVDPVVTSAVNGYVHAEHIHSKISPPVFVNAHGGTILEYDRSDFRLINTKRAPGGPVQQIQFGHEGKPFALEIHDVDAKVPEEYMADSENLPGVNESVRAVNGVQKVDSLQLEYQVANIATNPANFKDSNKDTLSGTDLFEDDASKPIKAMRERLEVVRGIIGVKPNVVEIPSKVWTVLQDHPNLLTRSADNKTRMVTKEMLAVLLEVREVVIGGATYYDENTNGMIDVWGNSVLMAYVPNVPTTPDGEPSFMYTYTMRGNPKVYQAVWDGDVRSWLHGYKHDRAPVLSGIDSAYLMENVISQ